jgi:apolipoprotein N-acyltransferase
MDLYANSRRMAVVLCTIALTAVAYLVSSGLHRLWWPVWFAPLPVLLLAPRLRAWQAFTVAVVARAIGALNLWNYVHQVVQFPFWFSLATILIPAVFFALAVIVYRGILRKGNCWHAALAFPVTMVAAEYLISISQGTFLSTGYTQLGDLPILQIAALAGIWGVSFTVNLLPAAIAVLVFASAKVRLRMAVALIAFYVCVLSFGAARLYNTPPAPNSVLVGLVETHSGQNLFPPDAKATMTLMEQYASQVQPLAARGAQFVIFPEMTALPPDSASVSVDELFRKTARQAHVQVLLGVLHGTDHRAYNEGRLYSATGEIETIYRKHHLVPTWESRSTPGSEISVLHQPIGRVGIEICRDMDYPELARRYANQQVGLVLVPAWDQGTGIDAYWHGHLSLMRGVEGGFTMVRDAKNGLLTASDDRGRVLAEEPTRSDGALVTMLATVPVRHDSTLYQKWGDWFAWIDLVGLAALLLPNLFGLTLTNRSLRLTSERDSLNTRS